MRSRTTTRVFTCTLVALALAVAGCGSDEDKDSSSTSAAPTTAAGAASTEAPTSEAPTSEAPTSEAPTSEAPTSEAPTTGGTGGSGSLEGASFSVGSKEFTEQLILGAITIQVLEAAGADVDDQTGLVGSDVVRGALEEGEIDMYWEYTGTGWIGHLDNTEPVVGEVEQYEAVRDADLDNGMVWLPPAKFNNTYAIALPTETADEFGLTKLSDLAAFAEANSDDFSLCAAAEFLSRDDGLPGLEAAYGFSFDDGGGVSELELGLVYVSVDKGDPCKFGEVFATDGRIAALGLTVLEDDQQFFASYLPSLVLGPSVDGGQIDALAALFAPVAEALDTTTMQALNAMVDVDGLQPEDVAKDFLESNGLLPS